MIHHGKMQTNVINIIFFANDYVTLILFRLVFGDHHETVVTIPAILWRRIIVTVESLAIDWFLRLLRTRIQSRLCLSAIGMIRKLTLFTWFAQVFRFSFRFVRAILCDAWLKMVKIGKLKKN